MTMHNRGDTQARRISRTLAMSALGITSVAGVACGSTSSSTPEDNGAPSVSIVTPADKTAWGGNVLTLELRPANVMVMAADGHSSPNHGHFHIFIDKQPPEPGKPIPKAAGIIHTTESRVVIPGLAAGYHTLAVVMGDGQHRRMGSGESDVSVLIEGPSVTATAPASIIAGTPLPVALKTSGIEIVKANGDGTGATGHFHLFVDRPAVRPGDVIPKEPGIIHTTATTVEVPDLAPGDHTIWVVLGDGNHRALDPAAEAKVTVRVEAPPQPTG